MTAESKANQLAQAINDHLMAGGSVAVGNYIRVTVYTRRHAGMFRARANHVEVRRGRQTWDIIRVFYHGTEMTSGCAIRLLPR